MGIMLCEVIIVIAARDQCAFSYIPPHAHAGCMFKQRGKLEAAIEKYDKWQDEKIEAQAQYQPKLRSMTTHSCSEESCTNPSNKQTERRKLQPHGDGGMFS